MGEEFELGTDNQLLLGHWGHAEIFFAYDECL